MSEWKDKMEADARKAKFDAVDLNLVKIAVEIYQPDIEGIIPDLLHGSDMTDSIDCHDAIFDYTRDHIANDDATMSHEAIILIAGKIASHYFPTTGS